MTDYVRTTDFDLKDTNNEAVLGSDFTREFNAVGNSSVTKANKVVSPTLDNIVSQTATGDMQDSGLKVSKTPQTDANIIFEKNFVYDDVKNLGSGSNFTVSWVNGNMQERTQTANGVVTFTAPSGGAAELVLKVTNSVSSRTLTWDSKVRWTGGTVPTPSGGGKIDIYRFMYDSDNDLYFGEAHLNY